MAMDGVDVTVVATDRTHQLPTRETVAGVTIRRVRAWPRSRDYYLAPGLWRVIATGEHDLVHLQGVHTLVPVLGMLACLVHRRPFVLTLHTGGHSAAIRGRLRAAQWRLLGPLLRRAQRLVAVAEFEADLFTGLLRLPPGRIQVIRNGGTLPGSGGGSVESLDGSPLIVSLARLERYKGHHRLIEAMPRLLETMPNARALILGTGPYERELRELAARLGVADQVSIDFVPPSDRDRLAGILRRADLVVLLSEYEAHPVAVMEAVALGCSVLVTINSGLAELVDEGLCSGVSDSATADEVAAALVVESGRDRPRPPVRLPDWDQCADEVLELYRTVLATTVRAAAGTGR
jgi:glycosyltransferase involved in cell wall biosynthesis